MTIAALAAAFACMGALGGVAWAAFTASVGAAQTLSTHQLGNPGGATSTRNTGGADTCTSITISWTAAPSADAYRVEVRENNGAWIDLVTETGNVTTVTDTGTHTNAAVDYRIHSRHASSNWEGATPAAPAPIACGIASVTDLVVTNPCTSSVLTWTAPPNVTNYDVQRRVSGGAWSLLVTDQTTVGYTDVTVHALSALVEYQVRPGNGAINGAWSTIGSVASYQPFRVVSITVGNSGVLGTLNAGDTIVVAFSKPVTTASIATNSSYVDNGGGNRGLYLATGAASTLGIGRLLTAAATFGATAGYAGTPTFSNANATWTWTSTVGGTTMTAALANEAFTAGTGPKCAADASALNGTYQPTSSGRW